MLGPDHPDTLGCRHSLAWAYESAGDLGRAIELFEAILADCERVLGPDHPNTLGSRSSLAGAYWSTGDRGRAIELCEATLADCERVLSPGHPLIAVVRANLERARAQQSFGRARDGHTRGPARWRRFMGGLS